VIATLKDDEEFGLQVLNFSYSVETVTAAIMVCSIIPVLIFYPFIQKYFNKGIMLGGVKE
jgi:putative aldouronate transport system permease protein